MPRFLSKLLRVLRERRGTDMSPTLLRGLMRLACGKCHEAYFLSSQIS